MRPKSTGRPACPIVAGTKACLPFCSRRAALVALVLFSSGCTCGGDPDPPACPQFQVGDPCEHEGQECKPPLAQCEGTQCTCERDHADLRWECKISSDCSCLCFCGKTAVFSCEAINCLKAPAPCPASAKDRCGIVCVDSGVVGDSGGGDGASDAMRDGARDGAAADGRPGDSGRRDGARDSAPDAPRRDGVGPDGP